MIRLFRRLWQIWFLMLIGGLFVSPLALNEVLSWLRLNNTATGEHIAPLFTAEVQHWDSEIAEWSATYEIDANFIATIMQIESCGHPTVGSSAGAQGLFQVMPFHFETGENMHDPNTNAHRGLSYMQYCLGRTGGDHARALACYNGGHVTVNREYHQWAHETRRYYVWGFGIYVDAQNNQSTSQTLTDWLEAGGSNLCVRAAQALRFQ